MSTTYKQKLDNGGTLVCAQGVFGGWRYFRDIDNVDERRQEMEFHIQEGDYFAVLATIFHIAANEKDIDMKKIFSKLAEDLQYLQDNYDIKKKRTPIPAPKP